MADEDRLGWEDADLGREMTVGDAVQGLLGAAVDALTPRQKFMVAVLGETDSMGEAAERLGVHPAALSARLRAIASRLGLARTGDLVELARRREVLDASSQAIMGLDSRGLCVFANRRSCEMFGYDREELVGRCPHEILHSGGGRGAVVPIEECPIQSVALGKGLTHAGETVLFHRDGSPLWVSYGAVAAGESGDRSVAVITMRDHSDQIRMQRELSLTNARLELALDAAGVTAFEVDLESQEMTGWGRFFEQGPGMTFTEFLSRVTTADGRGLSPIRLSEIPVGTTVEGDCIVDRPTGGRIETHVRVRRLAGDLLEPSRLLGVAVDMTAVREAERVHEAVLELSNEALVGVDEWGTVTQWNAAAEDLYGFSKGEALGAKLEELVIPVRHRQSFLESLRTVREVAGRNPISRGPLETTAVDSSGREFPVEWTATWVPVRDGMACRAFVRDISVRKAAEAELISGAVTDGVTGLANRALLDDRLGHALARLESSGGSLAVMFVDLDRFRLVNDSLGHATGDTVLRELAGRMKASLRLVDTVARFGGDKFVVLCEDTVGHEAMKLAERIVAEIQEPVPIDGQQISVGASIGISVVDGRSVTAEDPLRDAEVAMYRAKELGRSRAEMFDEWMRHRATGRLRAESDLRRAITGGELKVFYQPIVSTATEQIRGVEALVRWEHPERGLLPPSEFIPLAEDTGLIVPLGAWVLANACAEVSRWSLPADFHLAVNLAARQLEEEGLPDSVTAVLEQTGLPPWQLCVEITETGMMEQSDTATANLHRLHEMGIGIAIDDFGTGYSSLLRLRRFPIDLLKIDRLFVSGAGRNPDDTAILTAIVDLARTLGVSTLAEGVETPYQLEFIRSLGCQFAQGFRWSPPLSEPAMRELLALPTLRPDDSERTSPAVRRPDPLHLRSGSATGPVATSV